MAYITKLKGECIVIHSITIVTSITIFGREIPIRTQIKISERLVDSITRTIFRAVRRSKEEDKEYLERKRKEALKSKARKTYDSWGLSTMVRNCLLRELIMPDEVFDHSYERLLAVRGLGKIGIAEIRKKEKRIED